MHVATVDFEAQNAGENLAASLHDTGFAVLVNHPIDPALITDIYAEWKEFYNTTAKHNYPFDKVELDGYFPYLSENAAGYDKKNLSEFYNLYPWGKFPTEVSDKAQQLHKQLTQLAETLLTMIEENTPEEVREKFYKPLQEMVKGTPRNLLRIIHYPALQGDEEVGAIRSYDHEDSNFITLLTAATHGGLQVKDNAGNWHDVAANHGNIIINIGDMLKLASDNYYKSTTHRVINPEGNAAREARMSMPIFIHPHEEYPLKDGLTAGEFRTQIMKKNGLL